MKRCPECGNFTTDDSTFCPRCGRVLPDTPDIYVPDSQYKPPSYARKKVPTPVVLVVLAVVIIVVAFPLSSYIMGNYSDKGEYKDKTVTYEWTVPSIDKSPKFSIEVTLSGDELKTANNSKIDRTGSSTNTPDHPNKVYAVYEYVVIGNTIKGLSNALSKEFRDKITNSSEYNSYSKAQYFADFVLAFVDEVVTYELDSDKFGQDEYWQYPIETLYHGYGDCEDTSILASAIINCLHTTAGAEYAFDSACVFLLPGHAMVGININDSDLIGYKRVIDSKNYYFGETTVDHVDRYNKDNWYSIGKMDVESYGGASISAFTGTTGTYV